jgi:hypothetical protein
MWNPNTPGKSRDPGFPNPPSRPIGPTFPGPVDPSRRISPNFPGPINPSVPRIPGNQFGPNTNGGFRK